MFRNLLIGILSREVKTIRPLTTICRARAGCSIVPSIAKENIHFLLLFLGTEIYRHAPNRIADIVFHRYLYTIFKLGLFVISRRFGGQSADCDMVAMIR